MRYNKLVRDKIPAIIRKKHKVAKTHVASRNEYRKKLYEKLLEEAKEFTKSSEVDELADILEVVYAIAEQKGISKASLESARKKKASQRGGFKKRIILDEVV